MQVVYKKTTSANLDSLPIQNGQIIALIDQVGFYYDMNGVRYRVNSASSGHTILDADGTALTQRSDMQFSGYLTAEDDSTTGRTVISDAPVEITYESWSALSEAQKEGTHWLITGAPSSEINSPTTIGIGIGVSSTAASTAAKTATLEGYRLIADGIVAVRFVNAVPANATLNINQEGSVPIYYLNTPIVNDVIKAGSTATFAYDGTVYHLICTDISGDDITITPALQSGTKVADIDVNGVTTSIYAPSPSTEPVNADWNASSGLAEILNKPTLGTAAAKDAPASGDATTTQVVLGNDSRLTNARPASDVSAWAKEATKPTYTAAEVGLGNVGNFKAVSTVANQGLTEEEKAAARANIDAGESSFSGDYNDLTNKPTLGTASPLDVAASGDASATQVVKGDDSRLSDARPASDVSAWAKAATKPTYTAVEVGAVPTTAVGANNGVAELDSTGKVPTSQLPSYVDDVEEYNSTSDFPATGESGKIYIAKDTNKTYRWGGSGYVEISASLALGETDSTAYRGDRGKIAYDHSQLTSGNPHNVTASDVGLGNVGNFKAVSTEANQGLTETEKANARTNIGAGSSSFSGDYNDLTNKPTLGTASALDVPASGNASTAEVVIGTDTRLTDARPASDVSAWAKAATKPEYSYSEITGTPTLGTAAEKDVPASGDASNSEVVLGSDSRLTDARPASDVSAWAKASVKPTYTADEVNAVATTANQGLDGTAQANARANIGLGTAATKDVPASGNASTAEVVIGTDTRLTDARPASDVSSWAKAATKPTYTATEVGAVATTSNQGLTSTEQLNARDNIGLREPVVNQSLIFTNLVATVSVTGITSSTLAHVFFHDTAVASAAKITANTGSNVVTFTAQSEPSATVVVDISFDN